MGSSRDQSNQWIESSCHSKIVHPLSCFGVVCVHIVVLVRHVLGVAWFLVVLQRALIVVILVVVPILFLVVVYVTVKFVVRTVFIAVAIVVAVLVLLPVGTLAFVCLRKAFLSED